MSTQQWVRRARAIIDMVRRDLKKGRIESIKYRAGEDGYQEVVGEGLT